MNLPAVFPRFSRILAACLVLTAWFAGGGDAGRSDAPAPLKIAIAASPKQFDDLQKYLEATFHIVCVRVDGPKGEGVTGTEHLATCDVMLLNLYRTQPTPEQLKRLQGFFLSGKPVVGTRKASHAIQSWLEIDKVVFGAKYGGHYKPKGEQQMQVAKAGAGHPLAAGLGDKPPIPGGGFSRYTELAPDVEVLLEGGAPGSWMPQTWQSINKERGGQRVLYTRYDPNDVKNNPAVRDHVVKAIFWAAGRDLEESRRARAGGS